MFAVIIFILLWLMQVILLQSSYSQMKKNEINRIADSIEETFGTDSSDEYIDKMAYKNVSSIILYDLEGNVLYSTSTGVSEKSAGSSIFSTNEKKVLIDYGFSKMVNIDGKTIVAKTLEEQSGRINSTLKIDRFKSEIYIHSRILKGKDICLVIITSIDPIDSTTSVLQNQLVYITIISLVFSAVLSMFLSSKLSKPIQEMTKSANQLAHGNYDVYFKESGYEELDNLANTLNYATDKLGKVDKIRKELIANVSHDLKTPLTMIKAYSEKIIDITGDNKEKRDKDLQIIISETDRLTRLVNDMMDLSKIESGEIKLEKEEFDIVEVSKKILESFREAKISDESILKVNSPNSLKIFADKTKMEQVIYNFVNNAINHTPDVKKITINIKNLGKKFRLEVVDNGEGIKEADKEVIWNRYYQASNTYSRNSKGSGLGLSIVKNILEKHGAVYGVNSKINEGSTFWFEMAKNDNNK